MKNTPKDVDSYIAAAPDKVRAKLIQLRKTLRAVAPMAEEKISYGIPYYGYKGYSTARGTVRFPLDRPLPLALIRKLVRARLKKNQAGAGKFAG